MKREQILLLLAEAAQAADLRCGCLLDHKDLRLLVGRLAEAVRHLMERNDELRERLTRGSCVAGGASARNETGPSAGARFPTAIR